MRIVRRIVVAVVVTLAVVFVGLNWIAPIALSFYSARKAPAVTRVVPADLKDKSVSNAPGMKLSYFGYEFEVPWNDLDDTQTKLFPKDKPQKCKVDLHFRSGLRLIITAVPPREWVNELATELKVPPQRIETSFGESDYGFMKTLYEFTPDNMNHWSLSQRIHSREEFLLLIKSIAPMKAAETGIFNVQNQNYRGFQQGDSLVRQDRLALNLYSDDGSVEILFLQKDYQNAAGVTQPEINRIVQSLRKVTPDAPAAPRIAAK